MGGLVHGEQLHRRGAAHGGVALGAPLEQTCLAEEARLSAQGAGAGAGEGEGEGEGEAEAEAEGAGEGAGAGAGEGEG